MNFLRFWIFLGNSFCHLQIGKLMMSQSPYFLCILLYEIPIIKIFCPKDIKTGINPCGMFKVTSAFTYFIMRDRFSVYAIYEKMRKIGFHIIKYTRSRGTVTSSFCSFEYSNIQMRQWDNAKNCFTKKIQYLKKCITLLFFIRFWWNFLCCVC